MYYAKSQENTELELTLLLINQYLKEKKEEDRKVLEDLILNAYKLAKNEIDPYKIDRDIYDVVALLAKRNHRYFTEDFDPKTIDETVFKTVRNFMTTMNSSKGTFHVS